MQPYLLAYCGRRPDGLARSVLTAVARVGPNKTLFATCQHAVTQTRDLHIIDENGAHLPSATWAVIPVANPVLDLVFLFIRHDVPAERIRLNESPIPRDTLLLSHARNRFGQTDTPAPLVIHSASAKRSQFRAERGFPKDSDSLGYRFLTSEDEIKEARNEGVQTFYDVLDMESWTGVSGSALWDKFGAIRGMVCGGDSAETRQEDGVPRLVYIPAKTIAKQVKLILSHPVLRTKLLNG